MLLSSYQPIVCLINGCGSTPKSYRQCMESLTKTSWFAVSVCSLHSTDCIYIKLVTCAFSE